MTLPEITRLRVTEVDPEHQNLARPLLCTHALAYCYSPRCRFLGSCFGRFPTHHVDVDFLNICSDLLPAILLLNPLPRPSADGLSDRGIGNQKAQAVCQICRVPAL